MLLSGNSVIIIVPLLIDSRLLLPVLNRPHVTQCNALYS